MAKALQRLLGNNSPIFSSSLHALEQSTGHEGVDVRLIADVLQKSHTIMRAIGLDPADTTARELYMALNSYIAREPDVSLLLDTDYLLWRAVDEVVSLNLIDIVENFHHHLPFEQRSIAHAQRALRGELLARYHEHPATSEQTTNEHAVAAGIMIDADKQHVTVKDFSSKGERVDISDKPYIFAVGDIFSDAFIQLNEDVARIDTDGDGSQRLSLPFGSKPPYDDAEVVPSVGPSPNAAVSFARLGARVGLRSFLGDDQAGKESLEYLKSESIDVSDMSVQPGIKSNYYYVLRYKADRTILVKNEAYNYTWEAPEKTPDWLYLSLLADESWQLHEDLLQYLQENPDIKLAFQPGTFHFKWGVEKLKGIYARSHIVIMNREEAVDVTGGDYDDVPGLIDALHELGPHVVVVTDGANGSYASYDFKKVRIDNYPDPAPPLDRTGAGDAFASTIVAALAQGESMDTALSWAPINSMNVVQHLGAQKGLLHKDKVLKYLAEAPEGYGVRPLEG